MKLAPTLLAAAILLSATGAVQAALTPALGGQIINDSDLNIAWQANSNLAFSNTFGLLRDVDLGSIPSVSTYGGSYIYSDGRMTWGGALKWIDAMNSVNYLGYSDWRLPSTLMADTSCSQGTGDVSYAWNCTGSEMGHLFYNELGGKAANLITTTHNANYGLFQDIQQGYYWSGTELPGTDVATGFHLYVGYQVANFKDQSFYAVAVRPGQVAAVPAPAAAWLLGSGLLGLVGVARRKAA